MYLVVGRPNCPWCDKAKELLDSKELPYVYVDYAHNKELWMYTLIEQMNVRTVPQIFKLEGGYDNLRNTLDGE